MPEDVPATMPPADAEWLEADGLGGFASGAVDGVRTRRYHALLCAATQPPAGRMVLVNGFDAEVAVAGETHAISSQRYLPDVLAPDGTTRLTGFDPRPWPHWRYRVPVPGGSVTVEQELFATHDAAAVVLRWRCPDAPAGAVLRARLFFSGRDFHALHHENSAFDFDSTEGYPQGKTMRIRWQPYPDVPAVQVLCDGRYRHEPLWYRNFFYSVEADRGLDAAEDLAAPGVLEFDLSSGEAHLLLRAEGFADAIDDPWSRKPSVAFAALAEREHFRRDAFATPLAQSADAFLVRRGRGHTIIAGYPWFGDWGRDTFIAMRGLCLATGRLAEARGILAEWAGAVDEGMLPNRFPDRGETPEYNSVDASLWYAVAVWEYLKITGKSAPSRWESDELRMAQAVEKILEGYRSGTRYGIAMDPDDYLLWAGEPGVQLTWMDAKVGDEVVTPRIGKPVEIQALWINALAMASGFFRDWEDVYAKALRSFRQTFWSPENGYLYDVVGASHQPGRLDASLRPNQILAVAGLPMKSLLPPAQARAVVDVVEQRLLTPIGLRSLAPGDQRYQPMYRGGVRQRDFAYHQGTVWPWLMGPFVEAWVHVRGDTAEAKAEARERFLPALRAHLKTAGLGHVSEIADAEAPFAPRGCPFQAWSLGELIRLEALLGS